MKALCIDRYGGPEVLQLRDVPLPPVGDDDVQITVHAAGVNPLDYKIRDGALKRALRYRLPIVLGNELSGVVAAVGRNVRRFKAGDEVWARVDKMRLGAFAEAASVPQGFVAPKPRSLSHAEAASVPLVALTSWQALVEVLQLKAGDKVLIHAGAGGVGTFAIQLARSLGAQVATTASAGNHEMVRRLGAEIVIDYAKKRFEEELKGFDAVFDTLGGDTLLKSFQVLKPGGTVVSIAAPAPDLATARALGMNPLLFPVLKLLNLKLERTARRHQARYRYLVMRPDGPVLERIGEFYRPGGFGAVIDKTYPLAQAADALRHVETGRTRGKVVITMK